MIDLDIQDIFKKATITHYLINDGRIWSVEQARFVAVVPEDGIQGTCPDEEGNNSLKGLIDCLHFYNYPLGELKTDAEYASEARDKRDQLLAKTDYLVMPDYPLDENRKTVVITYRQALRDIPEQSGFPRQIIWPEKNF